MAERHPAYDGFISIHALREEGDTSPINSFQCSQNFNPRPPRGERRCTGMVMTAPSEISIHALREESDKMPLKATSTGTRFQSTPSARRAT